MDQNIKQNIIEEDEIDLRELFNTILKNKFKIFIFSFFVTTLSILYALSIPNEYKVTAILASQDQSVKPSLGGLGALAGLAGVDLSSSGGLSPANSYNILLNDSHFLKNFILKHNIQKESNDENYVFALGIRDIYEFLKKDDDWQDYEKLSNDEKEKIIFEKSNDLKKIISISEDKKTSAIDISTNNPDRFLAHKILVNFINDASNELREKEKAEIELQMDYYQKILDTTTDINLRTQIASLMSALIQKQVHAQAGKYYNLKMLIEPQVPYIKDKSKPKRSLIVVVAFVTSIILGVFGVFFLEFIKNEKVR